MTAPTGRPAVPFVVLGGIALVAGGLLSAASAFAPSYTSSWAVAYLVLVAGVAQLVLGLGQARLAPRPLPAGLIAVEVIAFDLGNLATLAGTVLALPVVVDLGAALLVVALALFVWGVRGGRAGNPGLLIAFRVLVVILLVSIPVGVVLAALRGR